MIELRRAPPWFESLTLRAVSTLARVPVDRLVHHGLDYEHLAMDPDGTLHATLYRAQKSEATVVLRPSRGGGTQFEHECSCRAWGVCPHTAAVLSDLAIADGLRDALVRGDDVSEQIAKLPRWRDAVHRAWTAERIATSWLPLEAATPAAPPEYFVMLPSAELAGRSLQSRVAGFDGSAALEVRVRLPGQRGFLDAGAVRAIAFAPEDRRILRLLDARSGNKKGFKATGTEAALALHLLRERPAARVMLADGSPLVFESEALTLHVARTRLPRRDLSLSLAPEESSVRTIQGAHEGGRWGERLAGDEAVTDALEARWKSRDGSVDVPSRETVLFRGPYSFLWVPAKQRVFAVDPSVDPETAWLLQVSPAVELLPEHAETLWKALRKRLRGRSVSLPSASTMGLADRVPSFNLHVDGSPLSLTARLEAVYPHGVVSVTPTSLAEASSDDRRDEDLEGAVLAAVTASGMRWEPTRDAFLALDDDAARFWLTGVQSLRERNDPTVAVMVPASLGGVRGREPITARLRLSHTGSMLDLALAIDAGGRRVDLDAIRAALAKKRRWVLLNDRSLAEISDAVADLLDDAGEAFTATEEGAEAKVPLHQYGRVERWLDAMESTRDESAEALRRSLRAVTVAPSPELPKDFATSLRPYQKQGLAWLQFLDAMGAGGVLADDMGLGKTVMTLALLAWKRDREGAAPSLVVCPTSVASNWVNEAQRFAPTLKVLSLQGLGASERATAALARFDLVVTTYALLRRDAELLRAVTFRYAVLDEAQNIKNADATTTRAARSLRAKVRLALTGTPVENRLAELWSIMDFANPGMLGPRARFEARYEKPIAAAAVAGVTSPKVFEAAVVSARLRALVRPFVLRRTRVEVLDDLPPRQEVDLVCPLPSSHRHIYDALAVVLREEVREFMRRDPAAKPGIAMFTALLRLRQMACDPRLVDPTTAVVGSKRKVFLATVKQLVAEGRRALVFSQFTELLKLWGADLDREGITYEYLDGATTARELVIRRFQEGAAPLFLVSLKAGGAGLNLTAADTVIHCDPWWNPAVEEQATARAHRIGQTRAVTVYRLVARGTVEDRVEALKDRKRTLADALLSDGGAEASALAGITADDVAMLLADATADDDDDESFSP